MDNCEPTIEQFLQVRWEFVHSLYYRARTSNANPYLKYLATGTSNIVPYNVNILFAQVRHCLVNWTISSYDFCLPSVDGFH